MIYELYPSEKEKPNNSLGEYYRLLCTECLDSKYLPQLKMEYSCMLYLYENNLDSDDWIGFTSYRQHKKSIFVLNDSNIVETINLLNDYDILCWLFLKFNLTISEQAEFYHKRITKNIEYLFDKVFKEDIPIGYYKNNCGCFANYWIMKKTNFYSFIDWSIDKVSKIVELSEHTNDLKLGKHYCLSSFIIERLFVIWHIKYNKTIYPLYSEQKTIL